MLSLGLNSGSTLNHSERQYGFERAWPKQCRLHIIADCLLSLAVQLSARREAEHALRLELP